MDHEESLGMLLWLCFRKSWTRFSLNHEGEAQRPETQGPEASVDRVALKIKLGPEGTEDDMQLLPVQSKVSGPW